MSSDKVDRRVGVGVADGPGDVGCVDPCPDMRWWLDVRVDEVGEVGISDESRNRLVDRDRLGKLDHRVINVAGVRLMRFRGRRCGGDEGVGVTAPGERQVQGFEGFAWRGDGLGFFKGGALDRVRGQGVAQIENPGPPSGDGDGSETVELDGQVLTGGG